MTSRLTRPTELERTAARHLRVACQRAIAESDDRRVAAAASLDLRPADVERLLRRDDWTLPGALRVADALGLDVRLDVQVR